MKYDKQGREMPDDTPVEVPLRFRGGAQSVDVLTEMMKRLKEDQEKELEETAAEFGGQEEEEYFDLPTRYELDHDAEERALTFAAAGEKMVARNRAREKEKRENRVDGAGQEGDRRGAGRDDREPRAARRKAERVTGRERSDHKDGDGGADGESED